MYGPQKHERQGFNDYNDFLSTSVLAGDAGSEKKLMMTNVSILAVITSKSLETVNARTRESARKAKFTILVTLVLRYNDLL